jgi:hypothetical protein
MSKIIRPNNFSKPDGGEKRAGMKLWCSKHPSYDASSFPMHGCKQCLDLWNKRQELEAAGIKTKGLK